MSAVIRDPRHPSLAVLPAGDGAIAFDAGGEVSRATFAAHVRALAARLPATGSAINLCEDRYAFLVAFCAVACRSQTNLLPPSRAAHAVDEALAANPDVAEKIRGGKVQAAGAVIGAVMKAMKGQADAARVREIVLERLGVG